MCRREFQSKKIQIQTKFQKKKSSPTLIYSKVTSNSNQCTFENFPTKLFLIANVIWFFNCFFAISVKKIPNNCKWLRETSWRTKTFPFFPLEKFIFNYLKKEEVERDGKTLLIHNSNIKPIQKIHFYCGNILFWSLFLCLFRETNWNCLFYC